MTLLTGISTLYDGALALVYPQSCECCGFSVESRFDGVACAACWEETHIIRGNEMLCVKCGALSQIDGQGPGEWRCGRCDDEAFDTARACGVYERALRASILALKREPHIARRPLKELTEVQGKAPLCMATQIVPVPLHPQRERERGFNQAAILGRALARRSGIPFNDHVLERTEHTERHRAGMDAWARRESVAGVFKVRHPRLVSGESILLVDDVYTTGATVSSCAEVLKSSGATAVHVLTLARSKTMGVDVIDLALKRILREGLSS